MKILLLQIKLGQFGVSENSGKKHSFTQKHTDSDIPLSIHWCGAYSVGWTIFLNIAEKTIVYSIRVTATWDFPPYYLTILEKSGL
jgi:hypothetical protein